MKSSQEISYATIYESLNLFLIGIPDHKKLLHGGGWLTEYAYVNQN
jgi:hypothetical protein